MVSKTNELGWIAVEIPFEAELAEKSIEKNVTSYTGIYITKKNQMNDGLVIWESLLLNHG